MAVTLRTANRPKTMIGWLLDGFMIVGIRDQTPRAMRYLVSFNRSVSLSGRAPSPDSARGRLRGKVIKSMYSDSIDFQPVKGHEKVRTAPLAIIFLSFATFAGFTGLVVSVLFLTLDIGQSSTGGDRNSCDRRPRPEGKGRSGGWRTARQSCRPSRRRWGAGKAGRGIAVIDIVVRKENRSRTLRTKLHLCELQHPGAIPANCTERAGSWRCHYSPYVHSAPVTRILQPQSSTHRINFDPHQGDRFQAMLRSRGFRRSCYLTASSVENGSRCIWASAARTNDLYSLRRTHCASE